MKIGEILRFQLHKYWRGFDTPTKPHMDDFTIARLTAELAKARYYVEFGSGGSTILADQMEVKTLTIESDAIYARAVRKGLKSGNVRVITKRIGPTGAWGYPLFNYPRSLMQKLWRGYVMRPFEEHLFPDLILVDGRFRIACALESARQANLRGATATLIVDDYESRSDYHEMEKQLGGPERVGRAAVFKIGKQKVQPLAFVHPA